MCCQMLPEEIRDSDLSWAELSQALFGSPLGFAPITTGWSVPPLKSKEFVRLKVGAIHATMKKRWDLETTSQISNSWVRPSPTVNLPTVLRFGKWQFAVEKPTSKWSHPTTAEVPIRLPTNRSKGLSVPWYKGSQPKRWVKVYPPGNCSHVSIGWFSGFPRLVRDMWSTNWLRLVPGKVNTWKQTLNTTKFVDVAGPCYLHTHRTDSVSIRPTKPVFLFLTSQKSGCKSHVLVGGYH